MTQQLFIKIRQGICSMYILGALLSICTSDAAAQAKNDLNVIKSWIRFSDAPNALYHHLAGRAFELLDKRANAVAAIHSLPDWKKRQEFVRKTLLDIVGPFPAKTPLNPSITRTIVKEYYKVEHIVYESQPGFYVTSSFYIPNNLKGKAPAMECSVVVPPTEDFPLPGS